LYKKLVIGRTMHFFWVRLRNL